MQKKDFPIALVSLEEHGKGRINELDVRETEF